MKKITKLAIVFLVLGLMSLVFSVKIFATDFLNGKEQEAIIGQAIEEEEINEENKKNETDAKYELVVDEKIEELNKEMENIEKELKVKALKTESASNENFITINKASDFKYKTLDDGTIAITGLASTPSQNFKVAIPDTIDGKKVSTIEQIAFANKYYLREVTMGSNVTAIATYAFYSCTNLATVNLANTKEIGNSAFYLCNSLQTVNMPNVRKIDTLAFAKTIIQNGLILPDKVEEVNYGAFAGTQITSLTLGKSVKSFDSRVLFDTNVTEYKVNSANTNFTAVDGVLYNKAKTELIAYPSGKTNTSYTMPDTVKTMKDSAAYGNKYLTSVKLSNNLEIVPEWAFGQDTSLKTITFGNKTKTLSNNSFAATAIENITLPSTITSITGTTFIGCDKLKNINVDSSNPNYASVNGVVFSKDKKTLVYYPTGKTDKNYSIPNGTVTVGDSAFQNAQISSVSFPTSVKKLEDWAFVGSNLTSITVPATITEYAYGTFKNCKSLTSATVNSSANISYSMFMGCSKLTTVTLNNNIKVIDARAFYQDDLLTKITLPTKLESLVVYAFKDTGITDVTIPASVKFIQSGAFNKDTKIDISKTKLTKMENGDYRITTEIYLNGTFNYTKAYECLELTNKERKAQGLPELTMNKDILDAAMQRAAETALSFWHTRPNGTDATSMWKGTWRGENIAAGRSTAAATVQQWMNSQGHKENILKSSFNSVGIGCFMTSGGTYYWVQCFSSDTATTPSTIPATVKKDVKIQTTDQHLNLMWDDTRKETSSADIVIGETVTKNVRSVNDGWSSVSTQILNKSFNWTSSNTAIATVNTNGKVTGKKVGTVTITATSKDGSKSIKLTVNVNLPFKDVKKTDWFYNAVKYTYENGMISGYNATTFAPKDKLTRGMMATILYRMENNPSVTGKPKFADVQDSKKYYYKAIKWATDKKIVSGYDNGKFGPNDNITREQLAVILYNYAKFKGKNTSASDNLNGFTDKTKVSSWALAQVKWAVGAGVITGNENKDGTKTLNPKGNATRAEVAAMLEKYCKKVGR